MKCWPLQNYAITNQLFFHEHCCALQKANVFEDEKTFKANSFTALTMVVLLMVLMAMWKALYITIVKDAVDFMLAFIMPAHLLLTVCTVRRSSCTDKQLRDLSVDMETV